MHAEKRRTRFVQVEGLLCGFNVQAIRCKYAAVLSNGVCSVGRGRVFLGWLTTDILFWGNFEREREMVRQQLFLKAPSRLTFRRFLPTGTGVH